MKQTPSILFSLLFALGCAGTPPPDAIARCPGDERSDAGLESTEELAGDASRGAELFAAECAKCHSRLLIERSSRLFEGYPRLDCGDFQEKVTDAYLHRVISKGGLEVGLDKAMKPFEEKLSEGEIRDLVAYVRTLAN